MAGTQESLLVSYYTVTPLHVGVGQAAGAVDLPVAKEAHTNIPYIPSTSVKGVWRDWCKTISKDEKIIEDLFGSELELVRNQSEASEQQFKAGQLIFTEAQLLFYPFRSLSTLYVYATCPYLLQRLQRNITYFNYVNNFALPEFTEDIIYAGNRNLAGQDLVIEDFLCSGLQYDAEIVELLDFIVGLCKDEFVVERLNKYFVILPDNIFIQLLETSLPVQARTKLTSAKTASEYNGKKGNLWYEEYVPADTMFVSFITKRPFISRNNSDNPVEQLQNIIKQPQMNHIQIGGNETVGYGLCLVNVK